MINTAYIQQRMAELKITQGQLAERCGMTRENLNLKLNNHNSTTLYQAWVIARELELNTPEEFCRAFVPPLANN